MSFLISQKYIFHYKTYRRLSTFLMMIALKHLHNDYTHLTLQVYVHALIYLFISAEVRA